MKLSSSAIVASVALAVLPAVPAMAADYEPPIIIDDAPEYVPVEIGSGWYLRGDLAYNFDKPFRNLSFEGPTVANPAYDETHTAISGSIGAGYHFSDYFRADLNLGFLSKNDQRLAYSAPGVSTTTVRVENEAWTAMANAFVDLGTYVGLTPYLGAGIGLVYGERDQSYRIDYVTPPPDDIFLADTKNQVTYAYTLNAGVSYRMSPNVSLDLGYQYFSAPNLEYSEISAGVPVVSKGVDIHQVKVGLRYDLW